jgi:hypothetical protein
MIRRRFIGPGTAIALAFTCLFAITNSEAAPSPKGAECTLTGSATISPGLTQKAQYEAIRLSDVKLANCRGGALTAPNTEVLSATVSTSPNPTYATASCAKGNLALNATIYWSNGKTTSASITTTGVAANQTIKGTVTSSNNPSLPANSTVAGDVAFKPTTTAQNCAKVPVTAVTFQGVLISGQPK